LIALLIQLLTFHIWGLRLRLAFEALLLNLANAFLVLGLPNSYRGFRFFFVFCVIFPTALLYFFLVFDVVFPITCSSFRGSHHSKIAHFFRAQFGTAPYPLSLS
jgi:hypothetical protein